MKKLKGNNTEQYGFYGRLKTDFPSQVIVDVTEVCNLDCIHCPHPWFKKSKYYSGCSLSTVLNEKIIDEVKHFGQKKTQYVRYCAEGEPLVHSSIYDMIEYAVLNSGVTVTLTTNGTIMNAPRIERLLATGVDVIDISIDAFTPDTYAKIRVNGNLRITRNNVLHLLKMAKQPSARTKVIVSYVEQPQNIHETRDFELFWKDRGADYVVVRRLHSAAGAVTNIADKVRKEISEENRRPCLYPWERIVLNPRGYLAFCPADWTHGSTIADYRNTTIHEIWRGEFYEKLRTAHLTSDFSDYQLCWQCPDWKDTRWPMEGRSYADMVEEFKETD